MILAWMQGRGVSGRGDEGFCGQAIWIDTGGSNLPYHGQSNSEEDETEDGAGEAKAYPCA